MVAERTDTALRGDYDRFALGEINHAIRHADTKASVLLAVGGVVCGIVLSRVPAPNATTLQAVGWIVALAAVALGSLVSLRALLPRRRVAGQAPTSLLYFDHVARRFGHQPEAYQAAFARVCDDPEAMRREVAGQIWANSLVACRKFRDVVFATWLLGAGLISCGVAVYLDRL